MPDKIRIAILDDYQQIALKLADWDKLPSSVEVKALHHYLKITEQVIDALTEFDVVCIMRERTPFTHEIFQRLPRLKLLITSGAKNAAIDVPAASEFGVRVSGTSSPGHAASELAWGLILALSRQIVAEDKSIRDGLWQTTIGQDLKGKTIGILGLGRHGSNIARYALAFGMRVIAWSQNLTPQQCQQHGVDYVDKQTLLQESDIITIHLQMGQRYRGLIDAEAFNMMKPTAYLINTSRGPIIDQQALIHAMQTQQIAGAGLDVYDEEPLAADHPLRSLPNSILTSHVGYVTEQTYRVFYCEMVAIISDWMAGKEIKTLI